MQLMAAIMLVGALSSHWGSLNNSEGHRVAYVHMKGVYVSLPGVVAKDYAWSDAVNDCSGDYCDKVKSAKTDFTATLYIYFVCIAIDIIVWFFGDVAWKFQEVASIHSKRRLIGWITAITSLVFMIVRTACFIACWSSSKNVMSALASELGSTGYSQPSLQTAEGIMFLCLLFNLLSVGMYFWALCLHTREKASKPVGIDARYTLA